MTRSISECIKYFDNTLYKDIKDKRFSVEARKRTLKSRNYIVYIIKQLCLKKKNIELRDLLNSLINEVERGRGLLTQRGLLNLILDKFPEFMIDFSKTEQAKRWITTKE